MGAVTESWEIARGYGPVMGDEPYDPSTREVCLEAVEGFTRWGAWEDTYTRPDGSLCMVRTYSYRLPQTGVWVRVRQIWIGAAFGA